MEHSSKVQHHSDHDYYAEQLLNWYTKHKRDLPWRRSKDPYHIWVSEIMLQQTRVDTVIPYYERFMDKFPTLEHLADAPEDQVMKAWEGLGYYSRARNLQSAVREVSELYGGVVPDDPERISGLRGVGPYTAGAILSIAYNRAEPAVDGNVMRVLSRFFLIEHDIAKPSVRPMFEKLVRMLIPEGRASDFNQALMELGALVCTPRSPHCLTCPVMERCAGRLAGREAELPIKKKAKPPRREYRAVALIEGTDAERGMLLIRRRPMDGLLAGMWELPHIQLSGQSFDEVSAAGEMLFEPLHGELGMYVTPVESYMDIDHVFSHIHWHMRVFRSKVSPLGRSLGSSDVEYVWIGSEDRERYTFPNVFNRILDAYWK